MGQIQNLRFCDGRNLAGIFSCPEFIVVRLDTLSEFSQCAFITGKDGMTTIERVAIATQFVSATDGIDCSIFSRPSHFKNCVTMAMCLIVALFFSFLVEVC